MKKVIRLTMMALMVLAISAIQAQTLEEALTKAFARFDTARAMGELMAASAQFDMAANKWSNEYAANYYAAYSKAIISFVETDKKRKDLLIDEANKYLDKVKAIDDKRDETYVLEALLINARIAVDGASRGMKYGGDFSKALEKAKSINPDNPRIYYLKANSLFYTPAAFGGGKKKAKEYYEKAKPLFAKEDKSSVLKPNWGAARCDDYLKQCEE